MVVANEDFVTLSDSHFIVSLLGGGGWGAGTLVYCHLCQCPHLPSLFKFLLM